VFKVVAAYLVVAWLLIQVVATLAHRMHLPERVPKTITLILLIGFPIAVVSGFHKKAIAAGLIDSFIEGRACADGCYVA
jgi:hypothetical protein